MVIKQSINPSYCINKDGTRSPCLFCNYSPDGFNEKINTLWCRLAEYLYLYGKLEEYEYPEIYTDELINGFPEWCPLKSQDIKVKLQIKKLA